MNVYRLHTGTFTDVTVA